MALERDLSSQRKALLRPLFEAPVDLPLPENPKNFPEAPGVLMLIQNCGGKLKVWEFWDAAKKTFPNIRMAQVESPDLKKLEKYGAGRASVLLQPSLYRTQKLTFPTDIGGIVLDA